MAKKQLYITFDPFTSTDIAELETTTYKNLNELMDKVTKMNADLYMYELDKACKAIVTEYFNLGYNNISSSVAGRISDCPNEQMLFTVTGDMNSQATISIRSRRHKSAKTRWFNIQRMYNMKKAEIIAMTGEEDETLAMCIAIDEYVNVKGMTGVTIGANTFKCFKLCNYSDKNDPTNKYVEFRFRKDFPLLTVDQHDFIMESFQGGICHFNKDYQGVEIKETGIQIDVNSMYPAIMKNEHLPFGEPVEYQGRFVLDSNHDKFFQKVTIRNLKLKDGKIPTIKKRNNEEGYYTEAEELTTVFSDVDLELLDRMYTYDSIEYICGIKFKSHNGKFKKYIQILEDMKVNAKNKMERTFAKQLLNNLYGKLATRTNRHVWKYLKPNRFCTEVDRCPDLYAPTVKDGKAVYAAAGAYITSLARKKLIDAIEANEENFIYSDTDSIYMLGNKSEGVELDENKFGAWKEEFSFKRMYIIGKKQYIVEKDNGELKITASGMVKEALKQITKFEQFRIGAEFRYMTKSYDSNGISKDVQSKYVLEDLKIN